MWGVGQRVGEAKRGARRETVMRVIPSCEGDG